MNKQTIDNAKIGMIFVEYHGLKRMVRLVEVYFDKNSIGHLDENGLCFYYTECLEKNSWDIYTRKEFKTRFKLANSTIQVLYGKN